ncbi:MAG: DUF1893 domain-containing protein [Clostridiales bacterium]|jgi:hypothetical protein|nr:DUF1893 domain-containing protein [Clostridiales bacterium]
MVDLEKAKHSFDGSGFSFVAVKGENVFTSRKGGVIPLLEFIAEGVDLKGFSAADKVIGKAAALLMVYCGIRAAYTPVISKKALEVFENYGIYAEYDKLVEFISNRRNTGLCPMEEAVLNVDEPEKAYNAVLNKIELLKNNPPQ